MRVSVRTVTPILGPLQSSYVLDNWVRGPQSLADYHRLDSTLYQPVDGVPVPVRKDFVRYDVGPALRWIVATQLACALYDCTLLDPAVLAA
ncbi:hypothetical protein [Streptomyces megasporus]|uniref:hypothetical protein n=1 Tax=Streptomyces megasporus TaxID=44060 RepID=UPI0004E22214|nr:hypothetical protein [Streptomyces megasporus]